jgi:hypothetical protein
MRFLGFLAITLSFLRLSRLLASILASFSCGFNANDFLCSHLVKALYDYQATIDEEFDFQAGDIIGVTATPEDGWWSGELLDEARRQRGRHVFPSNFVCLF